MEEGSQSRQKFGRYTLLERVTTGGMAEVYRAMARGAQGFSRLVAIKKILPQYADSREFQRMFVDEATIASRCNHANIAQVYDFDIHEGTPYIAMEFVEGKDLKQILRTSHSLPRPVPYPIAAYLTLEAAKGLYYVHSRRESSRPLNIIHRDVSPQNIMLSFSGEVKIVDFGIARAAERETETVAGTIKGKYAYMSPEQLSGESIDHRTDVFSLGIVLWEMLTLERLFAARSQGETINNVLRRQIPEPHEVRPDIPAALSPLVMCALERNRSNRYPTMLAFHEALSSFLFETSSYPELGRVTDFLAGLFPKEIEALRQGEHLTFTPTGQDTPDPSDGAPAASMKPPDAAGLPLDASAADRATSLQRPPTTDEAGASDLTSLERPDGPGHAVKTAHEDDLTVTATGATHPLGAIRERTAVNSGTHPGVAATLLVVVIGLLALFGWQFYQRIKGPQQANSSVAEHVTSSDLSNRHESGASAKTVGPTPPLADTTTSRSALATSTAMGSEPPNAAGTSAPQDVSSSTKSAALGSSPNNTAGAIAPQGASDSTSFAALRSDPPGTTDTSAPHDVVSPNSVVATPVGIPAKPERRLVAITIVTDPPDANIVIGQNSFRPGLVELKVAPDETVLVRVSKAGYASVEDRFEPLKGMERLYELRSQSHLEIWVEPKDAIVEVDGKELTRSGKAGYYVQEVGLNETIDLAIHRADYYPSNRTVVIDDTKVKQVIKLRPRNNAAALVERPSYGTVKISAKPYAEVYYGPEREGWGQVSAQLKKTLPEGDHIIRLHHAGTDTWAVCNITIKEGHIAKCAHNFLKE